MVPRTQGNVQWFTLPCALVMIPALLSVVRTDFRSPRLSATCAVVAKELDDLHSSSARPSSTNTSTSNPPSPPLDSTRLESTWTFSSPTLPRALPFLPCRHSTGPPTRPHSLTPPRSLHPSPLVLYIDTLPSTSTSTRSDVFQLTSLGGPRVIEDGGENEFRLAMIPHGFASVSLPAYHGVPWKARAAFCSLPLRRASLALGRHDG